MPGRSRSVIVWPSQETVPAAPETVFPTQFPVCWCRPVRALKTVDFPTLGMPASATVGVGLTCSVPVGFIDHSLLSLSYLYAKEVVYMPKNAAGTQPKKSSGVCLRRTCSFFQNIPIGYRLPCVSSVRNVPQTDSNSRRRFHGNKRRAVPLHR